MSITKALDRWEERRTRRRNRCRIAEEWSGVFIGRQHCLTHNVVWDDGGICPGLGNTNPTRAFKFARDLGTGRH